MRLHELQPDMYKGRRIAVVVPAHNEEGFVGAVLKGIPQFVDHIVVVDDGSTDGTFHAARAVDDPRIDVLRTHERLGVGGAMVAGYRRALDLGADVLVKMDADGQMAPEYLPSLLNPVTEDGYVYAKGNRFLNTPLRSMPRHRLFGNVVLTFMTKLASGYWQVFDPQNGYTAVTADALRLIDLDGLHRGYFFEADLLLHLNLLGARVKDVAIPARYGEERSDIDLVEVGLTFPVLLFRRFLRRIYQKYILRDFSPIALFLGVGFLLFTWGVAFGAYHWIRSSLSGQPTGTGTVMLAVLPLILGFQLILQAIVLDIHETPR